MRNAISFRPSVDEVANTEKILVFLPWRSIKELHPEAVPECGLVIRGSGLSELASGA